MLERKIKEGQKKLNLDVSSFPTGAYFFFLSDNEGLLARRKLIVSK